MGTLKTKSITISTGDHFSVTEAKLDKNVKAGPLNPKIAAAIKSNNKNFENQKKADKDREKSTSKQIVQKKKEYRKQDKKKKQEVKKKNQELIIKKTKVLA